MKLLFSFLSLLILSCTAVKSTATPLPLQVFILNSDVLEKNKQRIKASDAAITPAYNQLLKDADKALQEGPFTVMDKKQVPPSGDKHDYMSLAPYWWPDPMKKDGLPYIRKDGETNPEVKDYKDKDYMPRLCDLVHTLSLAYYFSGQEKYAEHAAKLIKVWYINSETKMNPNLNFAQAIKGVNSGRGAGLIDVRHFMKVIDGIGLLQSSKHWTAKDQQGMKDWFSSFLNWMQTTPVGLDEMDAKNNHGTYYDALRLSMALFVGNTNLSKNIIDNAKKRLDSQMDAEGKFPLEMERTIALHYSVFNMEAFFMIASMAEKMGIDFWNYTTPSGASLKKGFDFLHPYITNTKQWTGQQIKPYPFGEGYSILLMAERKYNCKDCREKVMQLAGDKAQTLKESLIY